MTIATVKCTNKKCYDGDEWQAKPKEWPRCDDGQKDALAYADIIEEETGDGYCASCVDEMADMGTEFIFMQKQLKEVSQ